MYIYKNIERILFRYVNFTKKNDKYIEHHKIKFVNIIKFELLVLKMNLIYS